MSQISQKPSFRIEPLIRINHVKGLCVLPHTTDSPAEADEMKQILKRHVFTPNQTHSLNVKIVENPYENVEDTDALITFAKDLPIGVFTADCVPILIYAPDVEGIAAIHAGWKGTLGGIIGNAIRMLEDKGADTKKMTAAFGPSISSSIYEVDRELAKKFCDAGYQEYVSFHKGPDNKPHIDLQGVNIRRMLDWGIPVENIMPHRGCSYSTCLSDGSFPYQSHRRSGGNPGRMLTCIINENAD